MKFQVTRNVLLPALHAAAEVCGGPNIEPEIFRHVIFKVSEGGLVLTGTNGEIQVTREVALEDEAVPGAATAPAKKLRDIVRSLPDDKPIRFTSENGQIRLSCGRARVALQSLEPKDAPLVDREHPKVAFEVGEGALRNLIRKVLPAMAVGDVRYYLNGINFEIGPKRLTAVATDGHRLSVAEEAGRFAERKTAILVPAATAKVLSQLLADTEDGLEVWADENHVGFEAEGMVLVTKRLEGKFPDWRAVQATESDHPIIVDRSRLEGLLKRALIICADGKVPAVSLAANGKGLVVDSSAALGDAHEEIPAKYDGQAVTVGFNGRYLLDALRSTTHDEVALHVHGADRAGLVHGKDEQGSCRHTVMPVAL